MAFAMLEYSKNWNNAEDFPTYEPDEAQVRADLQLLHDEAKAGINRLAAALNDPSAASQLPFLPADGLTSQTVRDAILETYAAIRSAAAGQILDGTVGKEKLTEALLARAYGGVPYVSADTPGSAHGPAADFPVGQVWLRPAFTVVNGAVSRWTATGASVVVENGDVVLTGNQSAAVIRATQTCTAFGQVGDRILTAFTVPEKDPEIQSLRVVINGQSWDAAAGGVFETILESADLTVTVEAVYLSAALATGRTVLGSFAVVNATEALRHLDGCRDMEDWASWLAEQLPLTRLELPTEAWIQTAPGQWWTLGHTVLPVERGGTGRTSVEKGRLLYGGDDYLETLNPGAEGSFLRCVDGEPVWSSGETVVSQLGSLRICSGSYVGSGGARTVTLPLTPKLLHIDSASGPYETGTSHSIMADNPVILANGSKAGQWQHEPYIVMDTAALSGKTLTLSGVSWNKSGVTYRWQAIY